MNSRDCFLATMDFKKVDRHLLWEFGYWRQTIESWSREGLPVKGGSLPRESYRPGLTSSNSVGGEVAAWSEDVGVRIHWKKGAPQDLRPSDKLVHSYFSFDKGMRRIPLHSWISPPFDVEILEENDETVVLRDEGGITRKIRKDRSCAPQFLSWPVKNRQDFERIKEERFNPESKERLPENWKEIVEKVRARDFPLAIGGIPCGFYGSLRFLMGEVNLLTSYYDNPDLVKDMLSFLTDFWISLWSDVLSQIKADCAMFWEDMCYNKGSLISPGIFRQFMMPCYKKITGFLKDEGITAILVDTDGDCRELIPLFMEAGVTGLCPFEVQAGMDIVQARKRYPDLQIIGGLDKRALTKGKEAIDGELQRKLPFMLRHGGYIPTVDHLVPPDVPWEHFKYYRKRIKEISASIGI